MSEPTVARLRTPHKVGRLVVAPSFEPGRFDSHACDVPFVFRHEGRYRMLYLGFDGIGYRTGLAVSDDLVHWEKRGMVLDRGPAGSPTEFNAQLTSLLRDPALCGPGEPVRVDGRFIGTYHVYPEAGYEAGPGAIGLFRSDDLRRWELGELTLRPGDGAAWERGGLYKPALLRHEGRAWMFYNAKDREQWPWREQIGVACSDDLVHWTRHEGNPVVRNGPAGAPDERFAADPCVLRDGDHWVMFYYGLGADGAARELAAVSDDLLTWRKIDEVLIDVGPPGSIDSTYAHKPSVIARDGVLYHFYCAVRPARGDETAPVAGGEVRGITVATSRRRRVSLPERTPDCPCRPCPTLAQ